MPHSELKEESEVCGWELLLLLVGQLIDLSTLDTHILLMAHESSVILVTTQDVDVLCKYMCMDLMNPEGFLRVIFSVCEAKLKI